MKNFYKIDKLNFLTAGMPLATAKGGYPRAFEIIEESLGSHFDPEIGKLFLKCRPQLEAYYDSIE